MRHVLLAGIALSAALAPAVPLGAQPATNLSPAQTAQGELAVTIYNNNRALIEDKRSLDLPSGCSRQEFRDVSAQIQPEMVSLTANGISFLDVRSKRPDRPDAGDCWRRARRT